MEFHLKFEDYSKLKIKDRVLVDDEKVKIDVLSLNVEVDFLIQCYSNVHIELVYESIKQTKNYPSINQNQCLHIVHVLEENDVLYT
jgi:hypothetical protein